MRDFAQLAARELGIEFKFEGKGEREIGIVAKTEPVNGAIMAGCKIGAVAVRIDPLDYRPTEVSSLLGDASLDKAKLGWAPRISLQQMVREMVLADLAAVRRDSLVKLAGLRTYDCHEWRREDSPMP